MRSNDTNANALIGRAIAMIFVSRATRRWKRGQLMAMRDEIAPFLLGWKLPKGHCSSLSNSLVARVPGLNALTAIIM